MIKGSLSTIFRYYTLLFALMPLLVVSCVLLTLFIINALEHAQNSATWRAQTIAIDANRKMTQYDREISLYSKFPELVNVADKPGNVGATLRILRELVINKKIDAAITLNAQGNLTEAFPFHYYQLENTRGLKLQFSQLNPINQQFETHQSLLIPEGDAFNNQAYLVVSAPLIRKENSFINPYRLNGHLVFLVSVESFTQAITNNMDADTGFAIKNSSNTLYSRGYITTRFSPSVKTSNHVNFLKMTSGEILTLQTQEPIIRHLGPIFWGVGIISLTAVAVFIFLKLSANKLRKALNTPLSEIIHQCEDISQGLYLSRNKEHHIDEFSRIQTVLDNMSTIISRQLKDLKREKDRAEQSEKVKSNFLATMSHEIRTPMNGVLGMLSLLEKSKLNTKQQRQAHLAKSSATSLLKLINDILDFSKIEARKLEIETEKFDIGVLANNLVDLSSIQAKENDVELKLIFNIHGTTEFMSDEARIQQILTNLLANAIKFSPHGKVNLIVDLADANTLTPRLILKVKDNGIGMSPRQCATVFESFTQADASTTRKFGGTGLGLTITKRLIDLMRGRISVTSEEGKGTEFTVDIPVKWPQHQNESRITDQTNIDRNYIWLKNKNFLIVEDNSINQEVIIGLLDEFGVSAEVANNGQEALDKLKSAVHFDLILMDCQMPLMDGYTATETIRNNPDFSSKSQIPIVALTANAFQSDLKACIDAGMNDVLTKPINEERLIAVLRSQLMAHRE